LIEKKKVRKQLKGQRKILKGDIHTMTNPVHIHLLHY